MTLRRCTDRKAANWILSSGLPWQQLVGFGPGGFAAYARLRLLPDPAWDGQSENDVEVDDEPEHDQVATALDVLSRHTGTPDDWYFCVWEGWGVDLGGPRIVVPERSYFLLRGRWDEWGDRPEPAFVWPADRAWCLAHDVDPHWAGIGADAAAVDDLLADARIDVVPADPTQPQPYYG
ncbi:hypothetical protein [Cryptosporangium japonicum]|uniref:Uncharacterized protein n=1 Tax=Cryptosporangium japonicum TaxID=80872 RepID=A0ABN0UZZ9_9ACTN